MMQRLTIKLLLLCAVSISTTSAWAQTPKPTDATSYCEKLKSIPALQEYATKMIAATRAIAAVAKDDHEKAKEFSLLYARGIDDAQRSLTKRVVDRINTAVPRADNYNQDLAIGQYAAWFAACASEMRNESGLSPLSIIFLSPFGQDINQFYNAQPAGRATVLQQIMGTPGLGGGNSREIETRSGMPYAGINPRWVLPMAIAMDGADEFIPAYAQRAAAAAEALAQSAAGAAQEKQAIASGMHPACQRIETSPTVAKFVSSIKASHSAGTNSDQMGALAAQRFDNKQGELTRLVRERITQASGSPRPDLMQQSQILRQYNTIIENCAVKNAENDLFLFFASSITTPDRIDQQREQTKRASGVLLNYDGKKPNQIDSINPMWASFYLFMFEDAEQLAQKLGAANVDELAAMSAKMVADRQARAEAEERSKYAGLRTLYAFSQNPAFASSFRKCTDGEKTWQTKVADSFDAAAKEADTVNQQKAYQEAAAFRRKNLNEVALGMCLYRLNFGLVVMEVKDVGAAIMLGADTKDLAREDPAAKYTQKAMATIGEFIDMSASKFHDDIVGKYLKSASDQLDQQRAVTRRQAENLAANRMMVGLMDLAMEEAIMSKLILPILESKHLP